MKGKGYVFAREKMNSSCKSSSSFSFSRRMLCDCGEEVALRQSNTKNNPGKMFWGCPNWKRNKTCGFFKWADVVVCDEQHLRVEESHFFEDEIERLKRKVTKLRKKLVDEKMKLQAAVVCIILLLSVAMRVSVYAVVNAKFGMSKRV